MAKTQRTQESLGRAITTPGYEGGKLLGTVQDRDGTRTLETDGLWRDVFVW